MPMDKSLYPADWELLALQIKEAAGWRCQDCGRDCKRSDERWIDFFDRMDWEEAYVEKKGRYVLTVAHLDHNPANSDRSNLRALCSGCHCRYDLSQMSLKKRLKRERLGQLNLLSGSGGPNC